MISVHNTHQGITLPNQLTILRFLLAPIAFGTYMLGAQWFALGLYIVGLITDLIDGKLARRSNTTSPFGRSMDSMADKALVALTMIALALASSQKFMAIFGALFVYREFWVFGLRSIRTSDQTTIAEINDRLGRIRFFILHTGMLILLCPLSSAMAQGFGTIAVGVSVVMGVGVSIYYVNRDAKAIHSSMMPANAFASRTANFAHPKDGPHRQPNAIVQ
jgi:CDP-diacylglycerol---glycerol-3-phosphate 3-phosphatidyltransferase